ncbi:hypothetical protein KAU11_10380 [Candidatus Babeliales bacterium]|nr:hypothetical protein [Candidatus Babeliales bacterium]
MSTKPTAIKELLKRPIAYQPSVAKALGSVTCAAVWGQLYYWRDKTKDRDGWFYKTSMELFEETGVTRRQQETARKVLVKAKVIEEKREGLPAKLHYRVTDKNLDNMMKVIEDYIGIDRISKGERRYSMESAIVELESNDKRRDQAIIALYFRQRGVAFKTRDQFNVALKRHLRPAKDLVPFSDEDILKGCKEAKAVSKQWTLETVIKVLTK